ncbi:kinase-like domain-containing protein [Rhizophagus irregularis DAOM 181602=DAOM 197198]|nr:kinase-like domain-containing protein [Rhizophagus irregularis DAOM 181602=DAOM 197198]
MDISNQNLDTTEITIKNNSKTDAKNLWKKDYDDDYQLHATIFSTDSTTESDETISVFKKVNIMDLEKRKELYGVCGECNEPVALKSLNNSSNNISNDFLNEIKYYISCHIYAEPVNSTDYSSSYQEIISSSSANPISECLDCELNELDLNQDDDE